MITSPNSNNEPPALTLEGESPASDSEAGAILCESPSGKLKRRDVASGETVTTDGLIRFVVSPEGSLVPDLAQKLPGRGLWIASERAGLENAIRKNIFSKAAKRQVWAEPGLVALVHGLLRRRCLELLGLARREGGLIGGFEKVLAAARSGKAAWIIEASDGAEDGRRRILHACGQTTPAPKVCGSFNNAELSLALGQENAIHVALLTGRRVQRWSLEMKRLSGFEPLMPPGWGGESP